MNRLLDLLAFAVRRFPAVLVVATVLSTGALGAVFAVYGEQDQGFANFAPENEVTEALNTIRDEFGTTVDPVQLVVEADDGRVLDADGVAAASDLRDRLLDDPRVAGALAAVPEGGAVATWADLVLQGAAAQGIDPAGLDDDGVRATHDAMVAELPAGQAAQATRLLGGGSPDAAVGAVVVLFDGEAGYEARTDAVRAVQQIADGVEGHTVTTLDFEILAESIGDQIEAELARLLALAFGLIVLILIAIFRRPLDVIAALLGLVFTIVWMQGWAAVLGPGLLGWTGGMSEMTMAIPILLVGLGVDYSIHLVMRYREERAVGAVPAMAATGAIAAVGAALALATLTTTVGFLTNLTNPLPPLRDFGVFAAVGVASAFLIMATFVPAVRVLGDRWRERRGRVPTTVASRVDAPVGWLGRAAGALAPAATHRPGIVLGAAGLLTVVGAVGATGLSTEFSQTEFFPEDSAELALLDLVDEQFGGDLTETTHLLVQGDVDQPGVLAALHEVERRAADVAGIRAENGRAEADSVLRRVEFLLEQTTGAPPDADSGEAPSVDMEAVASFLAAAETAGIGTDAAPDPQATLRPLVDAMAPLDPTVSTLVSDGALLVEFASSSRADIDQHREELDAAAAPLGDLGLSVVAASEPILIDVVLLELQATQINGLVLTLAAAMVILSLAFWFRAREPLLGVLAIVAVGLVVAWVFGLMALVGIPFNVMTAMVSALAIGIGVPFGIHVVNRFLEDRDRFDDLAQAMRSTLQHTGGALVGSAVTTMAGFGTLMLSNVRPFRQFGSVLAMTIGLALVASVVVLPAMLSVASRRRRPRAGTPAARDPEVDAAPV